jgi:urea transporter
MTATRTKAESLGPAFNRLWSASLASNLADGLFKTSALLLAATLTKDPVVISILAVGAAIGVAIVAALKRAE